MSMDTILWLGLNNAFFSLGLGLLAAVCSKKWHAPKIIHCLWLLVFLKLLTPPMFHYPIASVEVNSSSGISGNEFVSYSPTAVINESSPSNYTSKPSKTSHPNSIMADWFASNMKYFQPFGTIWLVGSISLLGWSLVRIFRFGRLLSMGSHSAPDDVLDIAEVLAQRLELKTVPVIRITMARISPMVWWVGGKVQIMIPSPLLTDLDNAALESVIAHEMAHVKRRDYLVRWLEWVCCVLFWWNPMVWWAQRNLRATEEICCDALVLSTSISRPSAYAQALLSVMEILAKPVIRPPAMASEINSDGFLEKRFKMIVQQKITQKRATLTQMGVILVALLVLPMGLIVAADFKAVERRLGEGVAAGELQLEEALAMMQVLRPIGNHDDRIDHDEEDLSLPWADDDGEISFHDDEESEEVLNFGEEKHEHEQYSERLEQYEAEADDLRHQLRDKEAMHDETMEQLRQLRDEYREAQERMSAFHELDDNLGKKVQRLKALVEQGAKSREVAESQLKELHQYQRAKEANGIAHEEQFAQAGDAVIDWIQEMSGFSEMRDLNQSLEEHERALAEAKRRLNQINIETQLTRRQTAEKIKQLQTHNARKLDRKMLQLQRQYESSVLKLQDMLEEGEISEDVAKNKIKKLQDEISVNKNSGMQLRTYDKKSGNMFEYQVHDGDLPKEKAVKVLRKYFRDRSENTPQEEEKKLQENVANENFDFDVDIEVEMLPDLVVDEDLEIHAEDDRDF